MGLDNQFRINELIQSGSTAITSLDADGRHTYFVPEERGSRDGESSAYFEKPQYNEGELQKAVDTQVDELITPTTTLRNNVVSLRAYERLQEQLSNSQSQNGENLQTIQSLRSRIGELESQVSSIQSQNNNLTNQLSQIQEQNNRVVNELREQLRQKDNQLLQKDSRINQLTADLEARSLQNTNLAANITEQSNQIEFLNGRIEELNAIIAELQEQLVNNGESTSTTTTTTTQAPTGSTIQTRAIYGNCNNISNTINLSSSNGVWPAVVNTFGQCFRFIDFGGMGGTDVSTLTQFDNCGQCGRG